MSAPARRRATYQDVVDARPTSPWCPKSPVQDGGDLAEEGADTSVALPPFADAKLDTTRWW